LRGCYWRRRAAGSCGWWSRCLRDWIWRQPRPAMLRVAALALAGLHSGWLQLAMRRRGRRHAGRLHLAWLHPVLLRVA